MDEDYDRLNHNFKVMSKIYIVAYTDLKLLDPFQDFQYFLIIISLFDNE